MLHLRQKLTHICKTHTDRTLISKKVSQIFGNCQNIEMFVVKSVAKNSVAFEKKNKIRMI